MTPATSYHHGDLPNALRHAAVDVIDERGLGSFSLREVARRAGVSHTAPAHHFGDMKGLLTSVAAEGFDALYRATSEAESGIDEPLERLIAIAQAYVALARSHHAHCEVMFRTDVVDSDDAALQESGMRAYGVLEDAVRSLVDREGLSVDLDHATWLCWSTMQGLVTLGPNLEVIAGRRGGQAPPSAQLVREFATVVVDGLRSTAR